MLIEARSSVLYSSMLTAFMAAPVCLGASKAYQEAA